MINLGCFKRKSLLLFLCCLFCINIGFSQEIASVDKIYLEVENIEIGAEEVATDATAVSPSFKLMQNDPYMSPYSFMQNTPNWKRLRSSAIVVGSSAIACMVILYLAPESFSNWDKSEMTMNTISSKWWKNVSGGVVIDKDDLLLNWVAHPYCGAIYYMAARSAGLNAPWSFVSSFAMSTFFWEFGIEALAERPSLQDIIITPGLGSILGEFFYLTKRAIVQNGYYVLGTRILGHTITFLIDPLNEILDAIYGTWHPQHLSSSKVSLSFSPMPLLFQNKVSVGNFSLSLRF